MPSSVITFTLLLAMGGFFALCCLLLVPSVMLSFVIVEKFVTIHLMWCTYMTICVHSLSATINPCGSLRLITVMYIKSEFVYHVANFDQILLLHRLPYHTCVADMYVA